MRDLTISSRHLKQSDRSRAPMSSINSLRSVQGSQVCSVLAFALLGIAAATAQEGSTPELPSAEAQLDEFARTNPDCVSFTDLCQTCSRTAEQNIECSTPGIACVRQPWTPYAPGHAATPDQTVAESASTASSTRGCHNRHACSLGSPGSATASAAVLVHIPFDCWSKHGRVIFTHKMTA